MEILAFILLAGVWAAFLLPGFVESRRVAPISTTKSYQRNTALLASVAAVETQPEALARRRTLMRRRQVLVALGVGAGATLFVAVWQGSMAWLLAALVFDVLLAAYVSMLLHIKRQRASAAPVVPLRTASAESPPATEKRAGVRIVAG